MASLQSSPTTYLILATISVQRLLVEVMNREGFQQRNTKPWLNEEFFIVVDSFTWVFEDDPRKQVYRWVKDLQYHQKWSWKQRYGFNKVLQVMKRVKIQCNGHIINTFNVKLAKLGIQNIRVLSRGQDGYQFFALSDYKIQINEKVRASMQVESSPRIRSSSASSSLSIGETYKMNVAPWSEGEPAQKILAPNKIGPVSLYHRTQNTDAAIHPIPGAWVEKPEYPIHPKPFRYPPPKRDQPVPGAWFEEPRPMGFPTPKRFSPTKEHLERMPGTWVEEPECLYHMPCRYAPAQQIAQRVPGAWAEEPKLLECTKPVDSKSVRHNQPHNTSRVSYT